MQLSLLDFVILLAVVQAVFLAVLIFYKHRRLYANRFLAILMLCYSVILLHLMLSDKGVSQRYPYLFLFLVGLMFIAFPLHYLYAKYLVNQRNKLDKREWLHFLLFILYEVSLLPDYLAPREKVAEIIAQSQAAHLSFRFQLYNWLLVCQGLSYLLMTLVILKKYNSRIKNVFSTIEKIKLGWLQTITYSVIFLWVIFMAENALYLEGFNLSSFNLSTFLAAALVCAMGYWGMLRSEAFEDPSVVEAIHQMPEVSSEQKSEGQQKPGIKYEKSGLSPELAEKYLDELVRLMQDERPYTDNELTLSRLAGMLSITPHNLSEVINTRLQKTFYDFINQYRIEQAKADLADPEKQHFKILSIAFDAGFNSKATFNTIFKKQTNLTPQEYRKKVILSSSSIA
jgi:AraC-like DNA-binding protein